MSNLREHLFRGSGMIDINGRCGAESCWCNRVTQVPPDDTFRENVIEGGTVRLGKGDPVRFDFEPMKASRTDAQAFRDAVGRYYDVSPEPDLRAELQKAANFAAAVMFELGVTVGDEPAEKTAVRAIISLREQVAKAREDARIVCEDTMSGSRLDELRRRNAALAEDLVQMEKHVQAYRDRHVELHARNVELERSAAILEGGRRLHGNATLFRRRPGRHIAHGRDELGVATMPEFRDEVIIEPSLLARRRWRMGGQVFVVHGDTIASWPSEVRAESWWHLCAKLGIHEFVAHWFYSHPEEDQASAVAKAPGRPLREVVIHCQGEED